MIKRTIIAGLLLTTGIAAQNAKADIDSLKWLGGCWEINQPERSRVVSEQWMAPLGNAMMGMSRTVRDGKMTGFEFLRIVDDGAAIYYISKPSENKDETRFKLIKSSAIEAVFEDPTHDFPQRIIYKLTGPERLDARIEGKMNGQDRGIDFPYKRTKCP